MRETYLKRWFKCPFYSFDKQTGKLSNHSVCHLHGYCAQSMFCNGYGYIPISLVPLSKNADVWMELVK